MRTSTLVMGIGLGCFVLAACGQGSQTQTGTNRGAVLAADEAAVLAFLNDSATSFEVLDSDCSLRSNAAKNIIARRDGPDGRVLTADDNPFHSLAEVDAISQVGQSALDKLTACAADFGFGPSQPAPPPPTTCRPQWWDGEPEDSLILQPSDLSPELATRVAELLLDARRGTHYATNPVRFSGEVQVLINDGVWIHYRVHFLETLNSGAGPERSIVYELDNCLGMVDVDHYF